MDQGCTGKVFSRGRAGPKIYRARKEFKSPGRGGAHTVYISRLKSYVTAWNLYLHCVKWSQPNILKIHNHDRYDHNHGQCCHVVSLWHFWIGKIRECHLYCAPPLPRGVDNFCWAGRGFTRPGGAARVFHGASGRPSLPWIPRLQRKQQSHLCFSVTTIWLIDWRDYRDDRSYDYDLRLYKSLRMPLLESRNLLAQTLLICTLLKLHPFIIITFITIIIVIIIINIIISIIIICFVFLTRLVSCLCLLQVSKICEEIYMYFEFFLIICRFLAINIQTNIALFTSDLLAEFLLVHHDNCTIIENCKIKDYLYHKIFNTSNTKNLS